MKTYVNVEVQIRAFITLALAGGDSSASGLGHFIPQSSF
jgi:hypothetical protein